MSEPTVPSNHSPENPQTQAPPPRRKPLRPIQIGMYVVIGLAVIWLVSSLSKLRNPAAQESAPVTPNRAVVQRHEQSQRIDIQRFAEQLKKAQEDAKAAHDRALVEVPREKSGIPAMTPEQQRRLYGSETASASSQSGGHTAQDDARTKAEAAKQKWQDLVQASLDSTAIPLDGAVSAEGAADKTGSVHATAEKARWNPEELFGAKQPDQVKAEANLPKDPTLKNDLIRYQPTHDENGEPTYPLWRGDFLDAVITNEINGDAPGPLLARIETDVYDDRTGQHLLIPQGTRLVGKVQAVSASFQNRLFASFDWAILPNGDQISLDHFEGLSQTGEVGLRDQVNHHYLQIFGVSALVGGIGGLSQIGSGYSGVGYDPSVEIRSGISREMAMESMQILNKFLNRLPTIHIGSGKISKLYLAGTLTLPEYRDRN